MYLKAKVYFTKQDFKSLKEMILKEPEILQYFTEDEKKSLADYAFLNHSKRLLFTMFPYINKKEQEKVIREHPLSILQQGPLENRFGIKDVVKEHIDTFLDLALNKQGEGILYVLSKIIATTPEEYKDAIKRIQDYLLKAELNENSMSIASFNCYYRKDLEDKIVESKNPKYISLFLENKSDEIARSILTSYINITPKPEDIKELAYRSKKHKEIMVLVEDQEIDNKLKSEYYLALYLAGPFKNISDILIERIIELNDFSSTKYLMKTLDKKVQDNLIEKYLKTGNESIMVTLACTTNCDKTYELIEEIIRNHIVVITILLVYLKDDYLTFAMNKLITTRKDIYLKIMDLCYKNDIKDDSSNNIWLSLFEFLLLNHLDQEYPTETIKIWQNRKNEVNKGLSRIRTLTER